MLVVIVVLLLAGVGADGVAERIVTDRAETRLAAEGVIRPQVEIRGFPFLTQLLDRRFTDVRLTAPALRTAAGRARDIDVTASDVEGPRGGHATAGQVRATGIVTYDEVLRQAGVRRGVELGPAGRDKVRLRGDAEVLGQNARVVAVGRVTGNGRTIRVEPTRFEVDGEQVRSAALLDALGARFTLIYRLHNLPEGLSVRSVEPGPGGFRVLVEGSDVTLPTGG